MNDQLTVPTQKIFGRYWVNDKGQATLILAPEEDESQVVYLRYALTEMGTLRPLWPAFVLDDWGNERKGLKMYQWIREEGERFPRAEVFGFDSEWKEVQEFLRALELYVPYPCALYDNPEKLLHEGMRVKHIVLPDQTAVKPLSSKRKPQTMPAKLAPIPFPLTLAQATWWRVHPEQLADESWQP